jgi:hypothetical protein
MQFKLLSTVALATLAAAIPTYSTAPSGGNAGDKCCNQVVAATNPTASLLLGLIGIVVSDVVGSVGLSCTVSFVFHQHSVWC